jgi:hypothetical protein
VVVQLNHDPTTTSPNLSCTYDMATALLSLSNHPQPSDQSLPPIGKPTNGSDDPIRQHKKQDFLVSEQILLLLYYLNSFNFWFYYFFWAFCLLISALLSNLLQWSDWCNNYFIFYFISHS